MAYVLVALLDDKARYPSVPPEFATQVGWLTFALALCMLTWAWTRAESVRRSILALEDPRTFAVLRIGFGLMTIINFANLGPYWRMLWSDEGMFDMAYAQDRMGRAALRGWTPDEGFFDIWAVLSFLWNKPSFFYMYGSPDFVVGHMLVLIGFAGLYTAGIASRFTGFMTWLLLSSVYNRNSLYWEGTDTVYRAFWFILLFANTGAAWSIDNWLRCRRLRKRGRLEDPDNPPDPSDTRPREPIYRLIPAWPRYLFMLQLAGLYCSTGCVKTGDIWAKGDALYYALNMDHFYRFEGTTQVLSAIFATSVFRLMTWVTHWWEMLFPLAVIGEVLRFGALHRDAPWYRTQHRGWRLWLGRAGLLAAYALVYRVVVVVLPFCLKMVDEEPQDPSTKLSKVHVVFGLVIPALVLAWFVLGRVGPLRLLRRTLSFGPLTRRFPRLHVGPWSIEQQSLRRWLLGRRLWLTLGFCFHGFLIGFMNIGMFPFIMLMTYAAWVTGDEYARVFAKLAAVLRSRKRLAKLVPRGLDRALLPACPATAIVPRGRRFPDALVLLLGGIGAYLVVAKVHKETWVGAGAKWWLAAMLIVGVALRLLRPRPADIAAARAAGPALAYGPAGRVIALFAFCWHTAAVGLHLFPPFAVFSAWRSPARAIFGSWMSGSGTAQSWEMFAPNPPRSNSFMKTVVVEADGDRWDLRNNSFEYRPNPWIINDRMRKMHRRMIGKGKWYLRYWANYQCREWELRTGEPPEKIDVSSLNTRIPSPEVVNIWQPAKLKGRKDPSGAITGRPYNPRRLALRETPVQTLDCGKDGRLPLYMKQRYGLPITEADEREAEREDERIAKQYANRRAAWDNRSDWGRWSETPEERRARAERTKRDREAEELEDRIEQAQDDGQGGDGEENE